MDFTEAERFLSYLNIVPSSAISGAEYISRDYIILLLYYTTMWQYFVTFLENCKMPLETPDCLFDILYVPNVKLKY